MNRSGKRGVSAQIMKVYQSNKQRLQTELSKPNKDKEVLNSIEAYRHIVSSMEQIYKLDSE